MKVSADEANKLLTVERWNDKSRVLSFYNFSQESEKVNLPVQGNWNMLLNSAAENQPSEIFKSGKENFTVAPLSVIMLETRE